MGPSRARTFLRNTTENLQALPRWRQDSTTKQDLSTDLRCEFIPLTQDLGAKRVSCKKRHFFFSHKFAQAKPFSPVEMYARQTKLTACTEILVALFWGVFSSTAHDCHRNLEPVWQSDVGSSPVVSSPVLADLNGDNVKDVLVTSFNGQVSVLDGRSGQDLPGWPVTLSGKMLFAAPLLVREAYTVRESNKFSNRGPLISISCIIQHLVSIHAACACE